MGKENSNLSNYTVTLTASGTSFEVGPGENVLEAALRQAVILPYSCRTGTCGTCKGRIVSGDVILGDYQEQALNQSERERGFALLCQTQARSDLQIEAREVAAAAEIEIRLLPCRVVELHKLTHDVMHIKLKLPQNQKFNFLAGQYIDLLMRDGRRRSFSIACAPNDEGVLELQVRRVPDGFFTNYVFEGMREKELLRFQGPLGTFFLRQDSDLPIVFVAGGTGLAPIKAIMEDALDKNLLRPMHLFWGVRSSQDLYQLEILEQWANTLTNFKFDLVLSEPDAQGNWSGKTGWVHETVLEAYPDLSNIEIYASGPPPMIEAIRETFGEHGLSQDRLFYDSFEFAYDNV